MTEADWIGAIGVTITLIAYLLHLAKLLRQDSYIERSFYLIGGALTCAASFLVHFFPFIVLEGVWSLVSLIALINFMRIRFKR